MRGFTFFTAHPLIHSSVHHSLALTVRVCSGETLQEKLYLLVQFEVELSPGNRNSLMYTADFPSHSETTKVTVLYLFLQKDLL